MKIKKYPNKNKQRYKTVAEWANAHNAWFIIPYGEHTRTDVDEFLLEQFFAIPKISQ